MASVLILSVRGEAAPIAFKLADEGHIVKMFVGEELTDNVFLGHRNPSRISDPRKMLEQYDLVLSDGLDELSDQIKEKGKVVLGGGAFNKKLESDAEYSGKVVSKLLTSCGTPAPNSINTHIRGWYNGREWLQVFDMHIVEDRLMDGNKGPSIGYMGSTGWCTPLNKLAMIVLTPLTPLFEKVGFVGSIDVECFASKDVVGFVRFTPRLCVLWSLMELVKEPLFNLLYKVVLAHNPEVDYHDGEFSIGISLLSQNNIPTLSVPSEAKKHVWLTKSNIGPLGYITARGASVRECQRRSYRTIKNIVNDPEVMYRSDIGNDAEAKFNELREWGWLGPVANEGSSSLPSAVSTPAA